MIRHTDNPAQAETFLAMRVSTREHRIGESQNGTLLRAPNFEPAHHSINVLYMRLMGLGRGVA